MGRSPLYKVEPIDLLNLEKGSVRLLLVDPARHYENRTDPCLTNEN
jgi:hypothetical protein